MLYYTILYYTILYYSAGGARREIAPDGKSPEIVSLLITWVLAAVQEIHKQVFDRGKSIKMGNPLKGEIHYTGESRKSLIRGNPLYREIPYKGKSLIPGNPRNPLSWGNPF